MSVKTILETVKANKSIIAKRALIGVGAAAGIILTVALATTAANPELDDADVIEIEIDTED